MISLNIDVCLGSEWIANGVDRVPNQDWVQIRSIGRRNYIVNQG